MCFVKHFKWKKTIFLANKYQPINLGGNLTSSLHSLGFLSRYEWEAKFPNLIKIHLRHVKNIFAHVTDGI